MQAAANTTERAPGPPAAARWQRLRRLVLGKASLWSLLPVLVALAGSAALNITYTRTLAQTRALVAHSLQVNGAIDDLFSALQDVETGQRGYLLTANPAYLAPYQSALAAIPTRTARLAELVRDNPAQTARTRQAAAFAMAKRREVDATLAAMRTRGFAAARALVVGDEGKRTMDSFRTVIAAMRQAEDQLLEDRVAAMRATEERLLWVVALGVAMALAARLAAFLVKVRARRRGRVYPPSVRV